MSRGVFLDRDGTVIEHVHHLTRSEDVALIPGAARAISKLRAAGFKCVLITNQSVVGRGMLTRAGLDEVHREMSGQLHDQGAELDGIYWCPFVPAQGDQTVIEHEDRKPGPGLLLRSAEELGISLPDSYMIGDSMSDLEAGKNAGCRESLLVRTGFGAEVEQAMQHQGRTFADLAEAAAAIVDKTPIPDRDRS